VNWLRNQTDTTTAINFEKEYNLHDSLTAATPSKTVEVRLIEQLIHKLCNFLGMFCGHVVASIFLSILPSKCVNDSGITIRLKWNEKSHKCPLLTLLTGRTVMYLPKLPNVLLAVCTRTYNNSALLKGLLSAQYYDDITYSTCSAITRHPNTQERQQELRLKLQILLKFKSQLC